MDAIQFAELEAFLDATRLELLKVEPRVECVTIGHAHYIPNATGGPTHWTASVWLTYELSSPNQHQIRVPEAPSLREAIVQLHAAVQEHARQRDGAWQCCVDGCSEKWVVTTATGNMCARHGMEWLASEKQAAEENRPPA